jgi:type VI secretion system protein ImpC
MKPHPDASPNPPSTVELPAASAPASQPATQDPDLLVKIIENTRIASDLKQRATFESGLIELARELESGELSPLHAGDLEGLINAAIGQIDRNMSKQVDAIIHHPKFQKLEANWRNLHRLVEESFNRSDTRDEIQIHVLDADRRDLEKDLRVGRTSVVSASKIGLYEKIYNSKYNTYGAHPFGALVSDLEFTHEARDVDLLEKIAAIAASAHAPFIAAASPSMFGWDQFTEIPTAGDIINTFGGNQYDIWRSFRRKSDARYVGLTLPRVLTRLPYDPGKRGGQPVETFGYQEGVDGRDHSKYLWGSASYALAGRMLESFALYGWCSAITGPKGGGKVDDLPLHMFQTGAGDVVAKSPTEVQLTDDRERALTDLGFISLVQRVHDRCAVFFGAPSCHEPKMYTTDGGNANAYLGTQLPYMMAASRFAHYLKLIGREEIGSMPTANQIRDNLQDWINQYVIDQDDATEEQRRRKPLRKALIEVYEIPGRPGFYSLKAFIRPHYKLEVIGAEVSLVAELPRITRGS